MCKPAYEGEVVCVNMVVERVTCIALLQSHVEWREKSWLVSHTQLVRSISFSWLVSVHSVPGANLEGLCDVLLL